MKNNGEKKKKKKGENVSVRKDLRGKIITTIFPVARKKNKRGGKENKIKNENEKGKQKQIRGRHGEYRCRFI